MPTLPLDLKKSESDFKNWVTSLRQAYSQRQKWALRIVENGCSSWPIATAMDSVGSRSQEYPTISGRHKGTTLTDAIQQWRTPSASDGEGGVMEMRAGADGKYKLRDHAVNETRKWLTPSCRDWRDGRASEETMSHNSRPLNEVAVHSVRTQPLAGETLSDIAVVKMDEWQTPASFQGRTRRQGATREQRQASQVEAMLPLQAEKIALSLCSPQHQTTSTDGKKPTKSSGLQLNPMFVEWLMGMPHGWTDCEHLETESFRLWQQSHSELLQRTLDCYESNASRP
jgi:hypothetical protein